jgi:hypothetical protein
LKIPKSVGGKLLGAQTRLRNPLDAAPPTKPKEKPMATVGNRQQATVQDFQLPVGKGATVVLSMPVPLSKARHRLVQEWLNLMAPAITESDNGEEAQADA